MSILLAISSPLPESPVPPHKQMPCRFQMSDVRDQGSGIRYQVSGIRKS
ncbi:MAG: hypothetical protein LBI62_03945 [Candidatus Accumulibacter sp.]|nr:hypothetical protein [Accumulibacter sp.]